MSVTPVDQLFNFKDKTVLVTGASGGIGEGIARRFSEAGANVAVHYRNGQAKAKALAANLGDKTHAFHAELTDPKAVTDLMDKVTAHFGRLDVLINNAGIFPNAPLSTMTIDQWRTVLAANTDSVFLCTQKAALKMKHTGGAIINIASISGLNAGPDHAHYNSSKAAVIMFTQSAAQDFGPDGIRVNTISPGLIERDGIKDAWPEGVSRWQEKAPLSRMGTPLDIADACLFLASPAAQFITGINLPVEGGIMASPIY